jgi:hypothetical protein
MYSIKSNGAGKTKLEAMVLSTARFAGDIAVIVSEAT